MDCLSGVFFGRLDFVGRSGKSSESVLMTMDGQGGFDEALRGPSARSTDWEGARLPMRTAK